MAMARPSPSNPLGYVVTRQYNNNLSINKLLLRERLNSASNLYRKDLLAHYGCVNAIEFSNNGELLVSGGDDRRVLIWNVEQAVHGVCKPTAMRAQHSSNIFCLGFDSINSKVFSAGNDDQVIVHDAVTGDPVDYFLHEQPVYSLSIDPLNDSVFASACDDGRILIYDIREPVSTEPFCLASYSSSFHGVMFNPAEPRLVTTANSKEGCGLWDVRKPRQVLLRYGDQNAAQSCMSVRFNQRGTQILALRRRLPPVVYAVQSASHVCQFDYPGYYNSCTMKSCCFAGEDDQYVLSGSDDFNLYMWKIPPSDEKDQWVGYAHMILRGHRSIVNQVRFNPSNYIIASSGVEKLIKFWSPFPLPDSTGSLLKDEESHDNQRKVFTHEEYIGLVLRSGQVENFMTHDYSHQSTKEDPRMMAFFDSLVQREIEGWSSEESATTEHTTSREIPVTDSESEIPVAALGPSYFETLEVQSNSASEVNVETGEAQSIEPQNRISQLIAQKRAQLMRLARSRTTEEPEQLPRTSRKRTARISSNSSDSSESGREVTANERADVENNNGSSIGRRKSNDSSYHNGKAGTSSYKKSEAKTNDVRKRRMKYMLTYSDTSDDDEDDDDEDWKPAQKRKKLWDNWRTKDSDSDNIVDDDYVSEEEFNINKSVTTRYRSKALCRRVNITPSDSDEESSPNVSDKSKRQTNSRTKKKKMFFYHMGITKSSEANGTTSKSAKSSRKNSKQVKKSTPKVNVDVEDPLSTLINELSDSCSNDEDDDDDDNNKVPKIANQDALVTLKVESLNGDESVEVLIPSTPNGKQYNGSVQDLETPDSGIAASGSPYSQPSSQPSSPCFQASGSSSSSSTRSQLENTSSSTGSPPDCGPDWLIFQRFKHRVERTRRNFRKYMGDSDSN